MHFAMVAQFTPLRLSPPLRQASRDVTIPRTLTAIRVVSNHGVTVDSMLGQEERKSRIGDKGRCGLELRTSESVGYGEEKQQVKTQN